MRKEYYNMGGSGSGSGGGGGSSGKVEWPQYFMKSHAMLLTGHDDISGDEIPGLDDKNMMKTIEHLYDESPYPALAAYNPSVRVSDIQTVSEAFGTAVASLNPVTDLGTYISTATGAVNTLFPDASAKDIMTDLLTEIAAINPTDSWTNFINEVINTLNSGILADASDAYDTLGEQVADLSPRLDYGNYITNGVSKTDASILPDTRAKDLVDAMLTTQIFPLDSDSDWEAATTSVLAALEDGLLPEADTKTYIDAYKLVVDALDIRADYTANAEAVATVVDDTILSSMHIDDVVNAFDTSQQLTLARALNDVASGFVDIGAVNSSAFVIGLALIQQEHQQQVAKFEADLRLQQDQTRSQLINQGIATLTQAQQYKLEQQKAAVSIYTQFAFDRAKLISAAVESIKNGTEFRITKILDATNLNIQIALERSRHIAGAASEMSKMLMHQYTCRQNYAAATTQLLMDRAKVILATVEAIKSEKAFRTEKQLSAITLISQVASERSRSIIALLGSLQQMLVHKYDRLQAYTTTSGELNRISIVAEKEQVDTEIDLAVKHSTWNLDIFAAAGNLLAGGQGGVHGGGSMPQAGGGPSALGGAITGAVSGAATGAMIGSYSANPMGTVIGAVVGAVVGGAAGYMSAKS